MTEPFILDYYNDYPKIIEVIDKMHKEAQDLKKENDKLKLEILDLMKNFNKELKEFKAVSELKLLLLEIAYHKKMNKKKRFSCF